MGSHKRFDNEEVDSEPSVPSNKRLGVDSAGPARKTITKSKQNNASGKKSRPKVRSVKSQIRSIERLLKNRGPSMTPGARKIKEDEVVELKRVYEEHERRERERDMASRYRMLKFFERRKLQRVLDNIRQAGDKAEDAAQKKQVLRDLRYITEYPKDQKYRALFPTGGHTEESRRRVEEMRAQIEAAGKSNDASQADSPKEDCAGNSAKQEEDKDDFFLADDEEE